MADGTLKVGTITTSSGSGTITLGQSGETVTIPSGVTLLSSTPAFHAYLSATQEPSNDTTTVVQFNTESLDTDSAYDNSTYRFTPQTSGKYFVYAVLGSDTVSGANLDQLNLFNHCFFFKQKTAYDITV